MAAPDGAASFSVDLARAPQAIAEMQDARRQLRELLDEALQLGTVVPPANDPVSRDAATVLGRAANGGSGSLVDAVRAGIDRMDQLIISLQSELASYRDTESTNTRGFDGLA